MFTKKDAALSHGFTAGSSARILLLHLALDAVSLDNCDCAFREAHGVSPGQLIDGLGIGS